MCGGHDLKVFYNFPTEQEHRRGQRKGCWWQRAQRDLPLYSSPLSLTFFIQMKNVSSGVQLLDIVDCSNTYYSTVGILDVHTCCILYILYVHFTRCSTYVHVCMYIICTCTLYIYIHVCTMYIYICKYLLLT